MELEEALKKYAINVPTDAEFYSEEYQMYFKEGQKNGKFEKYRQFQNMYNKSFYTTFYNKGTKGLSVANSKAVVLGGQTGAGKSSLVHVAQAEFEAQNMGIYLIDDDIYRMFYPKADEILEECPEFFTKITAIGSGPVTPKIMKYASDKGLNFIFDGTLKNPRIIQTAMGWENYDINWKIIATSKLESLLSIFERNEALRKLGNGRLIPVDDHNATYVGIEPTLMQLESMANIGRIQVYKRGENCFEPELQYDSTEKGKYTSACEALSETRKADLVRCMNTNIRKRIENLKNSDIPLNEAEQRAINDLERTINSEIEER